MKKITPQICRVAANRTLDENGRYFRLTISGFHSSKKIYPGQFVHIKVADGNDPFFRRAFSVADYDQSSRRLDIVYKVVGKGTGHLAALAKEDPIDLIGPLGNSFSDISKNKTLVIAAGGIGLPPLYFLARSLIARGHDPKRIIFFYGGRTRRDLVDMSRVRKLGVRFIPCTDDGSHGYHGFVTRAVEERLKVLERKNTFVCTCGPEPMLAVLQDLVMTMGFDGEMSLEAPMPCGVGVCLGCIKPSLKEPNKYVRVCYEGPVFKIGEVKI